MLQLDSGIQDVKQQTSGKNNLTFNTLGQQGVSPNYSASANGPGGQNYRCSYNEAVLPHGGEGWVTGDTTTVTMEGFNYRYVLKITNLHKLMLLYLLGRWPYKTRTYTF